MASAKDIVIKTISAKAANELVKRVHYSGKVVLNSQLHFGVFLNGKLEGVMQFGPPIDRRKLLPLVDGTKFNDFLELNRMAFSEALPRNSESRALSIAFKLIKKHYPHIEWIVSFSDGTQCGDGTIYRASGFILTAIRKNSTIMRLTSGEIAASHGTSKKDFTNAERLKGFQLRYIYFLNPEARQRLTVPILPFSSIDEMGAGMYKGIRRGKQDNSGDQFEIGGAAPTTTLQSKKEVSHE
jgi:hypothetical protein